MEESGKLENANAKEIINVEAGFPARTCTQVYKIKLCDTSPWFPSNKVVTEELHLTFLASFGEHFEHLIREKNSSVFSDKENTPTFGLG